MKCMLFYPMRTDLKFLPPTITMFQFNGIWCLCFCPYQDFYILYLVLFLPFVDESKYKMCGNNRRTYSSGEQRMKVFWMRALCKQWRKVVEASRFGIASAILVFEMFIQLKALRQNKRIIPSFEGTPYYPVLSCVGLLTSSWTNSRWFDVPSNKITTQNQISSAQKTT